MWPWGHLAAGYLLYTGYIWILHRDRPRGGSVVALAIGTQFPDMVDKPLAYWVAFLPEGRSIAHSVFFFGLVCAAILLIARRQGRLASGAAFAVGYGSHLVGDSYGALLFGRFGELTFLLWPALPAPDYEAETFTFHFQEMQATLAALDAHRLLTGVNDPFVIQVWLLVGVLALWISHRLPPFPMLWIWWASRGG